MFFFASNNLIAQSSYVPIDYETANKMYYRCLDDLPQRKYLDSVGLTLPKKKKFCYIITCIDQYIVHKNDSILRIEIEQRLKDIAEKLYVENTPTMLIHSDESYIEEMNVNGKIFKVFFLGDRGGCIVDNRAEFLLDQFNSTTKNLLGIIEKPKVEVKSKRKK